MHIDEGNPQVEVTWRPEQFDKSFFLAVDVLRAMVLIAFIESLLRGLDYYIQLRRAEEVDDA